MTFRLMLMATCLSFAVFQATAAPTLTNVHPTGASYSYILSLARNGTSALISDGLASYVWRNGVLTNAGTLGGSYTNLYSVSDDGNVFAGESETNTAIHAVRWVNGTLQDLGTLAGYSNSRAGVISGNGAVVAGYSDNGGSPRVAFRWENGVMQNIGNLGGNFLNIYAISSNGAVIAGQAQDVFNVQRAFRWTQAGGMQDLGTLGGNYTYLAAMTPDGSIIVGDSEVGNGNSMAYRWTQAGGMQSLGSNGDFSYAWLVTDDGNVIAGSSDFGGYEHATRWKNGVIEALGNLGGDTSYANAMNTTGTVLIGDSRTATGEFNGFIWREGQGIQGLGSLKPNGVSHADRLSTDGRTVVGRSEDATRPNVLFRWREATGMKSLEQLLTDAGVDITGWSLTGYAYMSDSGEVIASTGEYNGVQSAFIFREANNTVGLITPAALSASLSSASVPSAQVAGVTSGQVGQGMFLARQLGPAGAPLATSAAYKGGSGLSQNSMNTLDTAAGGPVLSGWQVYSSGGLGIGQNNDLDNHDMNGTVGVKRDVAQDTAIGFGVLGAKARSDMAFDGKSRIEALGLSAIAAYAPYKGLNLYGSVFAADLDLHITRGYQNGAGLDSSRGDPDGKAYGAAVQAGYALPLNERNTLMPYVEYRLSKTKVDAYTETGGAFAASFTAQDVVNSSARLGLQHTYALKDNLNLFGRAALAQRLNDDTGSFTATSTGLTQGLGTSLGDKTWAEAGIGASYQHSARTFLSTELTARTGNTADPLVSITASVGVRF